MLCNIIGSGSDGNAVSYLENTVMVDCGLPFSRIKCILNSLQLVLISHQHCDHLNMRTIKKLAFERPSIRFGIGEFLLPYFVGIRNVDILEAGRVYNYGKFMVSPIALPHDVPNFGFRLYKGDIKIIHCTDCAHLEGITAPNYDLYCIESNYSEGTIEESIRATEARGKYAYQKGSYNSHLSEEQCLEFFYKNKGENSELIRLHQSKHS